MTKTCGHTATGNGFLFVCDKEPGHYGWHEQRVQLRDSVDRTNWGSDGLAPHASKDLQKFDLPAGYPRR